jgi:hypothetical protein
LKEWQKDDNKFFKTKASEVVRRKISKNSILTIAGASKSGKTCIARNIALEYSKCGWHIIYVRSIHQFLGLVNPNIDLKQFYIFDDPLGSDFLNIGEYSNFSQPEINTEFRKYRHSTNIKIIFTCRTDILLERSRAFPIAENVLCIDKGDLDLSDDEKRGILKQYTSLMFTEQEMFTILRTTSRFPYLCSIAGSKTFSKDVVQIFKCPPIIHEEIFKLMEDDEKKFCALVILMINDGKLNGQDFLQQEHDIAFERTCELFALNGERSRRNILDKLQMSEGEFVVRGENELIFQHESIMFVVGVAFGRKYPKEMIEYCPMKIIRKCVL